MQHPLECKGGSLKRRADKAPAGTGKWAGGTGKGKHLPGSVVPATRIAGVLQDVPVHLQHPKHIKGGSRLIILVAPLAELLTIVS